MGAYIHICAQRVLFEEEKVVAMNGKADCAKPSLQISTLMHSSSRIPSGVKFRI